jgi:integrase
MAIRKRLRRFLDPTRHTIEPFLRAWLKTVGFHDLRGSAATLLLGLGIRPKIVSELLGHSQIGSTLDLYSHVTATMQQEAVRAFQGPARQSTWQSTEHVGDQHRSQRP